jgi:hypothetical protein
MPAANFTQYSNRNFYFKNFEGIEDFKQQGLAAINSIAAGGLNNTYSREWNSASFDSSFVGTTRAIANSMNWLDYIDLDVLNRTVESFDEFMTKVNMGGAFEKSKIIFTENKQGIFDFGLASKGLFRIPEFYSEKLKDEKPLEFPQELPGIIPPLFIIKNEFDDFWYTSSDGEKYQAVKQQKGTRALELKIPGAKLKFGTTTKKSYILIEKKGGKAKYVDLYVTIGGLQNLSYEGMLAKVMPLLLAARFFESAGIRTRINATRLYFDDANSGTKDAYYLLNIPMKDYGQDLDFNWIAQNVADPRWFRWNLWKYASAISCVDPSLSNLDETPGYGRTVYGGSEMDESFTRYKNWLFEKIEKGEEKDVGIDKRLMLIGGLPRPSNSISNQTQEIENEFYRIVDTVDFQFNKADKAAQRIYERLKEKNLSKTEIVNYIYDTLSRAYGYSQGGMYPTKQEEIDELDKEMNEKFEIASNFLASLK